MIPVVDSLYQHYVLNKLTSASVEHSKRGEGGCTHLQLLKPDEYVRNVPCSHFPIIKTRVKEVFESFIGQPICHAREVAGPQDLETLPESMSLRSGIFTHVSFPPSSTHSPLMPAVAPDTPRPENLSSSTH